MSLSRNYSGVGLIGYFALAFALGGYFTFASIQGDFGIFKRQQIDNEIEVLRQDLKALAIETERLDNLTTRLSDGYLDLDVLDELTRETLGSVRMDEVVLR